MIQNRIAGQELDNVDTNKTLSKSIAIPQVRVDGVDCVLAYFGKNIITIQTIIDTEIFPIYWSAWLLKC